MAMSEKHGNVLPAGKEITFRQRIRVGAPPQAVYDVLADVRSHLEWAGRNASKKFRLTGLELADVPVARGTEWTSTGRAPDGTFRDRSVVTEASPPNTFEFRTDAHVTFKKGDEADWKLINRYEITPEGSGSTVTYVQRLTEASALGPMKMMLNPILGSIGRMMVGGLVKPAMKNLKALAEDRHSKQ